MSPTTPSDADPALAAMAALDAPTVAALRSVRARRSPATASSDADLGPLALGVANDPTVAATVLADPRLTRIVLALCGGILYTDRRRLARRRDRLRRCLEDDERPWEERRQAAVELDVDVEVRLRAGESTDLELVPPAICEDSALAPLLLDHLARGATADRVLDALWTAAADHARDADERGDALTAVALAGDEPSAAWRAVLGNLGDAEGPILDRVRRRLRGAIVLADDALARVDGPHLRERLGLSSGAHAAVTEVLTSAARGRPPASATARTLLAAEAVERSEPAARVPMPPVHSIDDAAEHARRLGGVEELTTAAILEHLLPLVAHGGAGLAIVLDTLGERLRQDPHALVRALAELPSGGRGPVLAELGVPVGIGLGRVVPPSVRALTVLHAWSTTAPDLAGGLLAVVGPSLAAEGRAAHVLGLLADIGDDRAARIAAATIAAAPDDERPRLDRLWSVSIGSTVRDRDQVAAELRDATALGETGFVLRGPDVRRYERPRRLAEGHPSAVASSVEVCRWASGAEGGGTGAAKLFDAIAEGPPEEWRELQLLRLLDPMPEAWRERCRPRLVERLGELGPVSHPDLRALAPGSVPAPVRLGWAAVVLAAHARDVAHWLDPEGVELDVADPSAADRAPADPGPPPHLVLSVETTNARRVEVVATDASRRLPEVSIAAQEALLRERGRDLDPGLAPALGAAAVAAVAAGTELSEVLAAISESRG